MLILDTDTHDPVDGSQQRAPLGLAVAPSKKDLGLYAMSYGGVYVASISAHASHTQALRALQEADAFPGPSVVLAHAPRAGGSGGVRRGAKGAVDSGRWPLYRWNPTNDDTEPFTLDSKKLKADLKEFLKREQQLTLLANAEPDFPEALSGSMAKSNANATEQKRKDLQSSFAKLVDGLGASAGEAAEGAPAPSLLVLYGSDGGNASSLAELLAKKAELSGVRSVRCAEASELTAEDLVEGACGDDAEWSHARRLEKCFALSDN